jgi:hypothetical protein
MSKTTVDHEVDMLSTRGISMVMIVLTVLFSVCWLVTDAPLFQVAAFLGGVVSIMTWLSYCQQKTSAELEQLRTEK